ncbi:hypothetical protein A3Q56_04149 [Intoshia linei]|uniref:Uncharacterized protein n=1 Tax=Intoshia linei TaxID=1819745 RepID=A0A177B1H1_9BILA|nr:hypothetical protein A3Q56_04149 [Intoshia linei]
MPISEFDLAQKVSENTEFDCDNDGYTSEASSDDKSPTAPMNVERNLKGDDCVIKINKKVDWQDCLDI